jgi:DNA adenine methylase
VNNYPGGKNGSGTFQTIINQIPPHDLFVEAFAGSGAILRKKKPAEVTLAFDLNQHACANLEGSIPGITVINGDATRLLRGFLAKYDYAGSRKFVYLDPPYLFSTRKSNRPIYPHEFGTIAQHRELLRLIKSLDCLAMISGYWSELYERELKDWRTISYNSITRSGEVAKEFLWMNYPEPTSLHDYSFLGANFTQRQVIKRQVERWKARLVKMPRLKRLALQQALDEIKIS